MIISKKVPMSLIRTDKLQFKEYKLTVIGMIAIQKYRLEPVMRHQNQLLMV